MNIEHEESMSDLIKWFENAKLPNEPFQLSSYETITDPSGFYDALRRDIAEGTKSPRGRFEAVKGDLKSLKEFCEREY